jgi:5-methylcytosine-specific restriction endonuclease McrA
VEYFHISYTRNVSNEDNYHRQTSVLGRGGAGILIARRQAAKRKNYMASCWARKRSRLAGLGKYPEYPEEKPAPSWRNREAFQQWNDAKKMAKEDWQRASTAYNQKRNADPAYRRAQFELMELQRRREPQLVPEPFAVLSGHIHIWFYRDLVIRVESNEPESLREKSAEALAIKHFVLRRERQYERVRREVDALENIEKLEGATRERIPDSVRLFVWQRDRGQCVKCGSQQRLEFDHIIPVVQGGSSTERNVQLLCETCNRSKGSTI